MASKATIDTVCINGNSKSKSWYMYVFFFFFLPFFQASGVPVLSSLDRFERQTFHTDKIWQHVWGTFPKYLVSYSRDPVKSVSEISCVEELF